MRSLFSPADRRSTWALLAALALTVLLGVYYVSPRLTSSAFGHDEAYYMAMAQRLVEEHFYSYGDSGEPNAFVPPGLPLYLSLCYIVFGFGPKGLAAMRILQIFYTALTVFLAYVFCRQLTWNSPYSAWTGVVAAWIIATNLSFYSYTAAFLTENLYFLLMMLFAVFYAHTWRRDRLWQYFASGLLFCACVMIRSAIVAILPILLISLLLSRRGENRRSFARFALFLGGFTVLALPWWIRNAVVLHAWIPFCKQEHIVYLGLAKDLTGFEQPRGIGAHLRLLADLFARDGAEELRWLTVEKFKIIFLEHGSDLNSRLYTINTAFVVALGLPVCVWGLFKGKHRLGSICFLVYLLVVFCGVPAQRYGLQFLFYLSTQAAMLLIWIFQKIKRKTRVHS